MAEDDPAIAGRLLNIMEARRAFYQRFNDAMLAVGTRLRSKRDAEVRTPKLPRLPLRIDGRRPARPLCYMDDGFVCGDSALAPERSGQTARKARLRLILSCWPICARCTTKSRPPCATAWPLQRPELQQLQKQARPQLQLGARRDRLQQHLGQLRSLRFFEANAGVARHGRRHRHGHAYMAIGAAVGAAKAAPGRKTSGLAGDGGFILNLGELPLWRRKSATPDDRAG